MEKQIPVLTGGAMEVRTGNPEAIRAGNQSGPNARVLCNDGLDMLRLDSSSNDGYFVAAEAFCSKKPDHALTSTPNCRHTKVTWSLGIIV